MALYCNRSWQSIGVRTRACVPRDRSVERTSGGTLGTRLIGQRLKGSAGSSTLRLTLASHAIDALVAPGAYSAGLYAADRILAASVSVRQVRGVGGDTSPRRLRVYPAIFVAALPTNRGRRGIPSRPGT